MQCMKDLHKSHFIDKIVRDVRKLFVPNCSLCDAILWNSQTSQVSDENKQTKKLGLCAMCEKSAQVIFY